MNKKLKYHYEKALKHLLILEDLTHYELKDISEMIDKLQDIDIEDYQTTNDEKSEQNA